MFANVKLATICSISIILCYSLTSQCWKLNIFQNNNKAWLKDCISSGCAILTATALLYPTNTYAGQGSTASQLFSQAEEGVKESQKEYKEVENQWNSLKRKLIDNSKMLGKVSESLKSFDKDLVSLEDSVREVEKEFKLAILSLEGEVESLKQETANKFVHANDLQSSPNIIITKIEAAFREAEQSASHLEKSKQLLAEYKDSVSKSAIFDKIQQVAEDLRSEIQRADNVQIQQGQGLQQLTSGLVSNINACHYGGPQCASPDQQGVKVFRLGAGTVGKSQELLQKIKSDFGDDYKGIELLSGRLQRMSTQLHTLENELVQWERVAGSGGARAERKLLDTSLSKVDGALGQSQRALARFRKVDARLNPKNSDDGIKIKEVRDGLASVQRQLEKAEKVGLSTDKMLRQAKAQGEKEVRGYLSSGAYKSSVPGKSAAFVPTTPATPAAAATAKTTVTATASTPAR